MLLEGDEDAPDNDPRGRGGSKSMTDLIRR